jgi:hypothetical protein
LLRVYTIAKPVAGGLAVALALTTLRGEAVWKCASTRRCKLR